MKVKAVDFRVLEYLAHWEQALTATRLAGVFGVDRVHAQRAILSPYQRTNPGNLEAAGRARRLADQVKPVFGPQNLAELFETVDMVQIISGETGVGVPWVRVDKMASPCGEGAFRTLYAACARREAVGLTLEGPDGLETGRFSPHSLIRGSDLMPFRGHLTPFGGGTGRYVDIDPNRVSRVESLGREDYVGEAGDADWNATETVTLRLAEGIPPVIRAAALREYAGHEGIEAGRLIIRQVRRCVVPHLARRLRYKIVEEGPVEVWVLETGNETICEKPFEFSCET